MNETYFALFCDSLLIGTVQSDTKMGPRGLAKILLKISPRKTKP